LIEFDGWKVWALALRAKLAAKTQALREAIRRKRIFGS
jgi:hypothetical protein